MYTLVEAEYEIKDMLHFDGETIEDWIDRDLRRRAIEKGYKDVAISREIDNSEDYDHANRIWFSLTTDRHADGSVVYKAHLNSTNELPRESGVE